MWGRGKKREWVGKKRVGRCLKVEGSGGREREWVVGGGKKRKER